MKSLTKTFKQFLPRLTNTMLAETNVASFDFIKERNEMLKEFQYCLRKKNLVGLYCPLLGNGMFLVGVENIIQGDDGILIVFYNEDMSGHSLARRTLHIDEIPKIVPFNNAFVKPLPAVLRKVSMAS